MRRAAWGVGLGVLALAGRASATASTTFAETSRVAALADSVSARPGDAGSMFMNPAGLADMKEPELVLSGGYDHLGQWFARTGEPRIDSSRSFGAFGVAVATPLPGPWWLRRVRVGLALDLPAQYVLSVDIPERADQPVSPIYDQRPNRVSVIGAIAVDIVDQLKLGGGVNLTPSLTTPTTVTLVPGRSNNVQNDVVSDFDRSMPLSATPFLGARSQVIPCLSLALVYRGAAISHAGGPETVTAGPIVAASEVDYNVFWDPAKIIGGVEVGPYRNVSLSIDVSYNQWSAFRTYFDQAPDPTFKDNVSVMSGVEWSALPHASWLTVRAGGGYEPSPIPPQTGETNYLGASTVVLAAGAGADLRRLFHVPVVVDFHIRGRMGMQQTATKDAASLPDADTTTPGKQIDNIGYPGFSSRSSLFQAGLTATVFVGKDKP
jgi:long-chain fatty acid transport protein